MDSSDLSGDYDIFLVQAYQYEQSHGRRTDQLRYEGDAIYLSADDSLVGTYVPSRFDDLLVHQHAVPMRAATDHLPFHSKGKGEKGSGEKVEVRTS